MSNFKKTFNIKKLDRATLIAFVEVFLEREPSAVFSYKIKRGELSVSLNSTDKLNAYLDSFSHMLRPDEFIISIRCESGEITIHFFKNFGMHLEIESFDQFWLTSASEAIPAFFKTYVYPNPWIILMVLALAISCTFGSIFSGNVGFAIGLCSLGFLMLSAVWTEGTYINKLNFYPFKSIDLK